MVVPGQPSTTQIDQSNENTDDHTQGVVVPKVFATQSSDTEMMRLLLDRSTEKETVPAFERGKAGVERPTVELEELVVDTLEASMGRLRQGRISVLLEPLREYFDR